MPYIISQSMNKSINILAKQNWNKMLVSHIKDTESQTIQMKLPSGNCWKHCPSRNILFVPGHKTLFYNDSKIRSIPGGHLEA